MEEQNLKYISNIEIKGLWGRYDVNWKLNSDVNILVGENGTGKSTILKSIIELFELLNNVSNFESQANVYVEHLNISYNFKKDKVELIYNNTELGYFFNSIINDELYFDYNFRENLLEVRKKKLVFISNNFKPDFIKTFDSNPFDSNDDNKKNYTPLDKELDKVMRNYLEYQLNKSNQLIFNKLPQDEAFGKKLFLIENLNRLFKPTKKFIDTSVNEIAFKTVDDHRINWLDLSSGEKQLLIILLTVLCQDEKPSILLMDEPEISLDIAWQFELLSILRTLNPNCQLIIVTHSPAIYGKGWRDKVTFIEDIIPQLKKATV